MNPDALRGSRTGVYMGVCFEDMDQAMARDINKMEGFVSFGSSRFVFSNVVSFTRDLHGPSFTVDAACTSGFTALERAMDDLRKGVIEYAIVGAPNMTLNPSIR